MSQTGERLVGMRQYLLIVCATLLFLAIISLAGAKYYLSSSAAASKVTNRLETLLGMPVTIGHVDIAISGRSSLTEVRGFEAEGAQPNQPWITAQRIDADIAAVDLLAGAQPKEVNLVGVRVTLRFDKDGTLLTRLPHPPGGQDQPLPQFHIQDGELTLDQVGRSPMIIHGINGDITADGKQLKLTGTVRDSYWQDWTVTATADTAVGAVFLNLNAPRVQVNQEMLGRLPFVSPSVWESVQAEGLTPVDFTLRFNTNTPGVKYRVALTPAETRVKVTAINLDADHASGQVVVENALVDLRGVRGRFVGGDILLPAAELDFRTEPTRMHFDVAVKSLQLQELRERWPVVAKVPKDFKGQITGSAKLDVTMRDGKPHTVGSGDGVIDTVLFEFPAQVRLHLHADEDGFHINAPRPKPLNSSLLPFFPPQLAVAIGSNEVAGVAEQSPVEEIAAGLGSFIVNRVAEGGAFAVGRVQRLFRQLTPKEEATYLDFSLSLSDVKLEKVIEQFGLKFNFPVTGVLSFSVTASMPVDAPSDLHAYRAQGNATLSSLNVSGITATQVKTRFNYRDGVLALEDVSGQVPAVTDAPGTFTGKAAIALVPAGDFTATLKLDHIPAETVLAALPVGNPARGRVSGKAQARVPVERLSDAAAWTGTADLSTADAVVYGLALNPASAHVEASKGVATVDQLRGKLENAPFTGSAKVNLNGALPYQAALKVENAPLSDLEHLNIDLRPPIQMSGEFTLETAARGTLSPWTYKDAGKIQATKVMIDGVALDSLSFRWATTGDRLAVSDINGRLQDGRLTGTAVLPLRPNGALTADLELDRAEIEPLANRLLGPALQLQGRASGSYHARWSRADANGRRDTTAKLALLAPQLRAQGIAVSRVSAEVDWQNSKTSYSLTGTALDGKLELTGVWPPPDEHAPPDAPPTGHLTLQKARLSKLGDALNLGDALEPLKGGMSVDIEYSFGPDRLLVGRGHVLFSKVSWQTAPITDSLRAEITLNGKEVRIGRLSGSLAGGEIGGQIVYNLQERERSHFKLTLDRADAALVLGPLQASMVGANLDANVVGGVGTAVIQGSVQANLHGSLGRQWSGNGTIVLDHGKVYGADVTEWRLPVNFTFNPRHGRAQVDIRESTAEFSPGRATGEATFVFGTASRMAGSFRFRDVDMRGLFRSAGDMGTMAAGRVSGLVKFDGNDVRSLDDVTATLDASLTSTQALELPILRLIVPFLQPGLGSTMFQQGVLRARLAKGVIRVQHLTLMSDLVKLVIEGTITPQGRLDLDATAAVGNLGGLSNGPFLLLAREVPAVGPVPGTAIAAVSAFVANRSVRLHIGGSARSPSVQLQPLTALTEEAVRFLLGRSPVYAP